MTVDINKVISWFDNHMGKLTYSMTGSRNGADGTADCSGSMTQALYEAGASKPTWLYSTEYIHGYLVNNGFKLIAENTSWDAKRGDIPVFGKRGNSAGGAGHIGIISTDDPDALLLSTCYWTAGAPGTAVQNVPFDTMWTADDSPYFYVYRLSGDNQHSKVPASGRVVDQILEVGDFFKPKSAYRVDELPSGYGLDQVISYELTGGSDYSLINNGLGVESVDKCDVNGNKTDDQTLNIGDYFKLHSDRIEVVEIDPPTNGVSFNTRYGEVWVSAQSLTEVQ